MANPQASRLAKLSPCPLLKDQRIYNTLFFHLYIGVRSWCLSYQSHIELIRIRIIRVYPHFNAVLYL